MKCEHVYALFLVLVSFHKGLAWHYLHIYEDNAGNIWSAFPKEPMRKLIAVEHADLFRFIA